MLVLGWCGGACRFTWEEDLHDIFESSSRSVPLLFFLVGNIKVLRAIFELFRHTITRDTTSFVNHYMRCAADKVSLGLRVRPGPPGSGCEWYTYKIV